MLGIWRGVFSQGHKEFLEIAGLAPWSSQADQQRQDEQRVPQDQSGEALEAPADDDDRRRPSVGARHCKDLRLGKDGEARLPDPGRVRLAEREGP